MKQGNGWVFEWPLAALKDALSAYESVYDILSQTEKIEYIFKQKREVGAKVLVRKNWFPNSDEDPGELDPFYNESTDSVLIPLTKEETYLFETGKFYCDARVHLFDDVGGWVNPPCVIVTGVMQPGLFGKNDGVS